MIKIDDILHYVKAYNPNCDTNFILQAYSFAQKAHGGQFRASGEPYINHPLNVAFILAQLQMDEESIIAGLLHDIIEDTKITSDMITEHFGMSVALLVEGVSNVSRMYFSTSHLHRAANFRKFVMAIAQDIRILIIRLADRLHNMRTLKYVKSPEKRRKKAIETRDFYVPFAERVGLFHLRDELNDLSVEELEPYQYNEIKSTVHTFCSNSEKTIESITEELRELLKYLSPGCSVVSRVKSISSIWRKMKKKKISFEQLSDVMAFRIVVSTVDECYKVLGLIHHRYPLVPEKFKDYISLPKPNNYQSIHTVVQTPSKDRIEVQIRTHAMNSVSQNGTASQWRYKSKGLRFDGQQYWWLQNLLDMLNLSENPEKFNALAKKHFKYREIFCFTPSGNIVSLIEGATVIDFVYAFLGQNVLIDKVKVKINGKDAQTSMLLHNGDIVDIIEFDESSNYLLSQAKGLMLLKTEISQNDLEYTEEKIHQTIRHFRLPENILEKIGEGKVKPDYFFSYYKRYLKGEESIFIEVDTENKEFAELLKFLDEKKIKSISRKNDVCFVEVSTAV